MSHPLQELRSLSREDLIHRHDQLAQNTFVGIDYYLAELARRDAAEQTAEIVRLTRIVAILTAVITVLTAASLLAVLSA
jgi:hypothetical protein